MFFTKSTIPFPWLHFTFISGSLVVFVAVIFSAYTIAVQGMINLLLSYVIELVRYHVQLYFRFILIKPADKVHIGTHIPFIRCSVQKGCVQLNVRTSRGISFLPHWNLFCSQYILHQVLQLEFVMKHSVFCLKLSKREQRY